MATPPEQVRAGLALVAAEATIDLQAAAASTSTTAELEAVLFVAAPIVVSDYSDGAAALALEWYEELREIAAPRRAFSPEPIRLVTDENVKAIVAAATRNLRDASPEEVDDAMQTVLRLVSDRSSELVLDGFRDTMTANALADPGAVGWRRFARPEACKFCKMLAAKGAVFTEKTARFAAHGAVMAGGRKGGNCMCIAGPEFGGLRTWTEASPMQYMASRRKRSPQQRIKLREYLAENFPDAPG